MAMLTIRQTVDEERAKARELVDYLHALAEAVDDPMIADAAAMLDGCQAGITLFSPHRLTGYVLVSTEALAGLGRYVPAGIDVNVQRPRVVS